jgi:hypothetical protein
MKHSASCFEAKFERKHVHAREGRTLIVGSHLFSNRQDRRALYPDAVGVDMQAGPGVDVVADLEEPQALGTFAHIDCLSVLEHSRRPWLLAANLESMLQPGGTIYVAVPFVWRVHGYPSDYWRFTADGVRALFPGIAWDSIQYASTGLGKGITAIKRRGHVYFPRAMVCAFGRKCAS